MTEAGPPLRVLVVGADTGACGALQARLAAEGADVRTTGEADGTATEAQAWVPDAVVLDGRGGAADAVALAGDVRRRLPRTTLLVVADAPAVSDVVRLMRAGAADVREAADIEQHGLLAAVRAALDDEAGGLPAASRRRLDGETTTVWRSQAMRELHELISAVAPSDASVLIVGESGSGKEVVANEIHARSGRAGGPFVKIDCAALPRELIEAELFGYRRGAFTGAVTDRRGLFEEAHGGSLLLDEIGGMPPLLQTKLLRVLQEREFRSIGGAEPIRTDFRLICATNADPAEALGDGRLRQDLFYRINTITLQVPPLRARPEDLAALCEQFVAVCAARHRRPVSGIAPDAWRVLARHGWPGNVRELEHAIERAVLVARGPEIGLDDLPESIRGGGVPVAGPALPAGCTLAELERLAIVTTLERTGWNKQEAAQILGLYRPTLYSKMKKHGIRDPGR